MRKNLGTYTIFIKVTVLLSMLLISSLQAFAQAQFSKEFAFNFDDISAGSLPEGWTISATNPTTDYAEWSIAADDAAPSKPNVLSITKIHDLSGDVFNLFWTSRVLLKDGVLQAMIRADSGQEDQGGGLVWRAKDEKNYYVARYNPLERNLRVYYVKNGNRKMLASANARIKTREWFNLKVDHRRDVIRCYLDGTKLLEVRDKTFFESGGVGFWTKADAASSFDDLIVGME